MKSCRRCFENVYVGFDGNVTLCPWNIIIVGNLLENTLDEKEQGYCLLLSRATNIIAVLIAVD